MPSSETKTSITQRTYTLVIHWTLVIYNLDINTQTRQTGLSFIYICTVFRIDIPIKKRKHLVFLKSNSMSRKVVADER